MGAARGVHEADKRSKTANQDISRERALALGNKHTALRSYLVKRCFFDRKDERRISEFAAVTVAFGLESWRNARRAVQFAGYELKSSLLNDSCPHFFEARRESRRF